MSARTRLSVLALAVIVLTGCSKNNSLTTQPLAELSGAGGATIAAQVVVTLPAGSADGLAAALAAAGPGGKVIVAAGNHTESGRVLITQPVTIEGQAGAVITSTISPLVDYANAIETALHVKGAGGVVIAGLELLPAGGIGGAAIIIEDSPNTVVRNNKIREYQYGVLVHEGERAWIDGNQIATSTAWQTGQIPEAYGIVVINGERARITNNDVSNGLFNIWACDKDGTLQGNRVHDGFIGIIFCKVPAASTILPGGEAVGAEFSATNWICKRNDARDNFDAGYLVIDGSNKNMLVENTAGNNGTYDIDLVGDSYRFGFLTPASFLNTVRTGSESTLRIKDCGNDNSVIRGNQIDINTEPCT